MKHFIIIYLMAFFGSALLYACSKKKPDNKQVTLVCLRSFDTLHVRIANNSRDTIYVPSSFEGSFNVDDDSIFLAAIDKPKYNTVYYYRYSKLFPFEIYTAKKIENQVPDSTVKRVYQTYYFNQFVLRQFIAICPDSTYSQSIIFNVPQRANIAQAVYYKKTFSSWMGRDSLEYLLGDFIKFDSLNAKYISAPIVNRFYLQ